METEGTLRARGRVARPSGRLGARGPVLVPLLALLSLAAGACKSASAVPAAPPPSPEASRIASDVRWLADDAREGRRAGSRGEHESAEWIAQRFAELGLEPAGVEGYLQPFEIPLPARDGGSSAVAVVTPEGDPRSVFDDPRDLAPLFCSAGSGAEGAVVFAGYGIASDELGWNDYGDADVAGKIVLVLRGTPSDTFLPATPAAADAAAPGGAASPHGAASTGEGSSWGNVGSIFHKVMEAKRRGAVAVLVSNHPAKGEKLLAFDAGQTAEANLPALIVSPALAATLVPGFESVVARLDAGEKPGTVSGGRAKVRAHVIRETGTATNVLARLHGERSDRTLVIGAHFDHLGRGGPGSLARDAVNEIHNGADDNASGSATVLEIARCMVASGRPEGDVVFALWSGEELGLLGSEHWIKAPTVPLADVRANLNLDMVGRLGSGKLQVLGAGTARDFGPWLEMAGKAAGLDLAINASGEGVGGSDHQSFLAEKIPALHFFSGVHEDYHKPSDDADKIDAQGAARVASVALELVRDIQAPSQLPWVAPPAPAANAARGGFRTRFGSVPDYSFEGQGKGMLLAGTSGGGPAERAGLQKGDIIVRIDDVKVEGLGDFMYVLNAHKPGDVLLVHYQRGGEEREVRVTLEPSEVQ